WDFSKNQWEGLGSFYNNGTNGIINVNGLKLYHGGSGPNVRPSRVRLKLETSDELQAKDLARDAGSFLSEGRLTEALENYSRSYRLSQNPDSRREYQNQIDRINERIQQNRERRLIEDILNNYLDRIATLESEVVQLRGQIVNLNARVRELEGNVTSLRAQLRQVQAQGVRNTARIAALENELREARVQLARTIARLNEQAARARTRATADATALEQAINENRSNQRVITGLRELQQQSQEALRAANTQIAQLESTHGAEVRELRSRLERAEGRNGGPDWINGASDRQIANELNLGSMNGSYHRGSNTTVDVMNIVNLPYRQYDMVTVEKLLHARLDETKGGELLQKKTILPTAVDNINIDKRRNTRIRNSGTTRMMMSSYYDDRDLSNVITNIDTNLADIKNYTETNILIPLSLEGRHAVGLLMVKQLNTDSTYKAYYLDSENNNIPQGLLEIFNEHGYEVEHLPVEQQQYMNCGPEVIENFMLYTYGERFSQEEAMIRDSHIIDESMSKSIINTEIALLDLQEKRSVSGEDRLVEDLILEKNTFASVELLITDACGTS
ncbi:MAG: hypothetical protein EB127_23985, partial [Alphaproteobacteria bacterium]|nr:hypothetical protein [Alphaproteobacteria bacterium]